MTISNQGSHNASQRSLWVPNSSLSRRQVLAGAGGAAAALALASCSSGGPSPSGNASPSGKPKRGGDFRFGVLGTSKDVIDPHAAFSETDVARVLTAYEPLVNLDDNLQLAVDSLAESMEVDSPTQYTFRLRQGIEFHNGKTMTADDVLFSLRRVGSNVKFGGNAVMASMDLAGMKKLDKYTVRMPLKTPDSTVPLQLAVGYRFGIVPEGYKGFSGDVSTQAGTGPFKLKSFTPGQESVHERNPNYWREGQPYLDTVTITNFSDKTAQVNALLGQQIHALTGIPSGQISAVKARGAQLLETWGGVTVVLCMHIDTPPFDDIRVREAFRLIPNRQGMADQAYSGRGSLGNDTYNADFTTDLPQRAQDIAKAKELLKAAGHENLTIDLPTTPYSPEYIAVATVFAQHAKEAGVTVNVKNMPQDQYWAGFGQWPFSVDSYAPKPYLIQVAERSLPTSPYHETHWPPKTGPGSEFVDLYNRAVSSTDDVKRLEIQKQMVELEYVNGGYIIPVAPHKLDAHAANVKGLSTTVKTISPLNDFGHSFRTIWLA